MIKRKCSCSCDDLVFIGAGINIYQKLVLMSESVYFDFLGRISGSLVTLPHRDRSFIHFKERVSRWKILFSVWLPSVELLACCREGNS